MRSSAKYIFIFLFVAFVGGFLLVETSGLLGRTPLTATTPVARQQGLLSGLEQYYRSEIPRQKLLEQLASGLYVTDAELWRSYQDAHDSAQVSYVAFRPPANLPPDTTISEG